MDEESPKGLQLFEEKIERRKEGIVLLFSRKCKNKGGYVNMKTQTAKMNIYCMGEKSHATLSTIKI